MLGRSGSDAADVSVRTLDDALRLAFGPRGKGILLKEASTGILTVTRTARDIAIACFDGQVPPPWLLPALQASDDLGKRAGDGGKGVLLGTLAVSRMELPPRTVREILTLADRLSTLIAPVGTLSPQDTKPVVRTFLETRFAPAVLSSVLPRVCDWLDQDREFALRHIDTLCILGETSGPVSETSVSLGAILKGAVEGVPQTQTKRRLMVIQDTVPSGLKDVLIVSRKYLEDSVLLRLMSEGTSVIHGLNDADVQLASTADFTDMEVKRVPGGLWMSLNVRQIVIRAPVPPLGRQIRQVLRDTLALVCFSDSRLVRTGAFERCLLKRLFRSRVRPPPLGRELLLTVSSPIAAEDALAGEIAGEVVELCRGMGPDVVNAVGMAVSASLPPKGSLAEHGSDVRVEPVTLRLSVLQKVLTAGALSQLATAPLPARRLHS